MGDTFTYRGVNTSGKVRMLNCGGKLESKLTIVKDFNKLSSCNKLEALDSLINLRIPLKHTDLEIFKKNFK